MKKLLALTVLALCLGSLATHAQDKPNIVFMLADNLGYGDVGAYGAGEIRGMPTPNIDRLASEGLRFTQFLVEPGCTPSRAGLMTGRYSIRLGLSSIILPGTSNTLAAEEVTLGELFKSQGYGTAYIGKWHLGPESQSQPQNQGFDEWRLGFFGTSDVTMYQEEAVKAHAPEALRNALHPKIMQADGPGQALTEVQEYTKEYKRYIEKDIADEAVQYITEHAQDSDPFFLFVGWTHPHFPNDPHPDFVNKSRIGKYGDSVMELDYRTGEVLEAIKEAGIEDNTIVIWISDNGPTITGTSYDEIGVASSGPFSGELGDAKEGSIRTVGMIKWPGKITPGVTNEMIAIHDFFPTLATIIGAAVPTDRPIDGVDQTDFLLGNQPHSNRESFISFIGPRLAAVRWRQFRFYPVTFSATDGNPHIGGYVGRMGETAGFPEIYNIEADPMERQNIAVHLGWTVPVYARIIAEYKSSLVDHPNPPAANLTKF